MTPTKLVAAVTLLVATGCGRTPTESSMEFVVRVDSISAPAVVPPHAEFTVVFRGTVGGNTCHSLARTEESQSSSALEITFVGARCIHGNGYAMMIGLDHSELIRAPAIGSFVVRARQPDGATLEKRVSVR